MVSFSRTVLLLFIFLIGFSSLLYEIYSVRVLFMFFIQHTQAVSVAISSFIGGLAISSLLFSRLSHHNQNNIHIIFWMQLAAGLYGFFILSDYLLIPKLLDATGNELFKLGIMWIYLFIPAFFIGGAFPLINGLVAQQTDNVSEDTGIVYFWDMLGAITGALLTGFVLLPQLGLQLTVLAGVTSNLLVALWLAEKHRYKILTLVCLVAVAIQGYTVWPTHSTDAILSDEQADTLNKRFGTILFEKDSPFGVVRVGKKDSGLSLYVNYRSMCRNYSAKSSVLEVGMGRVTMRNLKQGDSVANIGLGCGITAREVAYNKKTKHLDIIEINPVVLEATRKHFTHVNRNVVNAKNVNVIIEDGAEYMRKTDKKYAAVIIDIEEVSVIYSSPLFTQEYYKILKSRLQPGGMVTHWSFNANPTFSKVMYNTLKSVFKHVYIQTYRDNIVFYASDRKLNIPQTPKSETLKIDTILAAGTHEINTLENPALEKYFNIREIFYLPEDYNEPFIKKRFELN